MTGSIRPRFRRRVCGGDWPADRSAGDDRAGERGVLFAKASVRRGGLVCAGDADRQPVSAQARV